MPHDVAGVLDDRAPACRGRRRGTARRCSRANCAAVILPSMPRPPKPPGMSTPCAWIRRSRASARDSASASTKSSVERVRRGGCRRGAAPRRPTGRRPAAARTCRRARCAPRPRARRRGRRARSTPRGRAAATRCRSRSQDEVVEALGVQRQRHAVDVRRRPGGDRRASVSRSANSAILARSSRDSGCAERQTTTSGVMPMRRSSLTECCVGFVFSSPAASISGTSVHVHVERRCRGRPGCAAGGWPRGTAGDSMSPTVPPISTSTTSTSDASADAQDAALDLVGDVRDDLHRRAEVVAAALLADHAS